MKYSFLFINILLLNACKPPIYHKTDVTSVKINSEQPTSIQAASLIKPYKEELDAEMNEVLVISAEEFPKEKGKSETKLGNLVADLSLEVANGLYKPTDNHNIDFCLLNFGGLRTSLPKGEITRGKVFELMPFENELVVVTITKENLNSLIEYLKKSGGQPISGGLSISFGEPITEVVEDWVANEHIKVLTSDYLANGGDNMNFFLNPIKTEPVGIKLRDAIIQYCKEQNKQGKQLVGKLDGRITFE